MNEYLDFETLNNEYNAIAVIDENEADIGKIKIHKPYRIPKNGETILLNGCHVVKYVDSDCDTIKVHVYNKSEKL
jgi:hypothetical protein